MTDPRNVRQRVAPSGARYVGNWRDRLAPYLFISPFVAFFLVLFLAPSIYSIFLSLHRYRGFGRMKFVGFRNYVNILKYAVFWQAVRNTLFYLFWHWAPVMVISFSLALVVRTRTQRFQRVIKPLIFLPHMMAIVAASLVWRVILSTNHGVINAILGANIAFLSDPKLIRPSVVVLMIWRSIGWFFVVFLAGLTTVSDDLREAARIDGAAGWQIMLRIVIPIMRPIFLFTFLMETIHTLKVFTQPNILISGWLSAPPIAKPVMGVMVDNFKTGFFGMASATGWLLFLGILVASMVQLKLFGRED